MEKQAYSDVQQSGQSGKAGQIRKVSVHGGHSGQFCQHAKDDLEAVIQAYIQQDFAWVGITEHMPPQTDARRYPDEMAAGLDSSRLQQRFRDYFRRVRDLQDKYRSDIEIFSAFETETYQGSAEYVQQLIQELKPDYIVGSVHHVRGIPIDFSLQHYERAIAECGRIEQLYCEYFDEQYAMLQALQPAVVGHLDLVRIFDPNYSERLQQADIRQRIERNLDYMQQQGLILDYNMRGYHKGAEAYPTLPLLQMALDKGVAVVPGDDSHGVDSVGLNYARGVQVLAELGVNLDWPKPRLYSYA